MRHLEESVHIEAPPERVFACADDHRQLASHMNRRSWMIGNQPMETLLDAERGQAVGSHIRMSGKFLGVRLELDEVVTERQAPHRKKWETVGVPRLIVIGPYQMGFTIDPEGTGSRLRVFIHYDLPARGAWLGRLFGGFYARWCVWQMLRGVSDAFVATSGNLGKE